jgi:hypothetical protein
MRIGTAALVYAAVTALVFHDLLAYLATHLYGDLGDPLLNAAILAWNAKQIPLTEAWWNFPSFAPLTGVTALTEHLLLAYPIASPIVWATGNAILANNVVFLLSPVLNAVAMYALARELTGSASAAFVAGLAFAFAPYQAVQLSHIQTMMAFGMPVALLGLHRYVKTGEWKALAGFGAGWLITALSNAYALALFPVLVALWCLWFLRIRQPRRLVAVMVTALVVVLALVPLLWGYHLRHVAYGLMRDSSEIRAFSADLVGLGRMYRRLVSWRGVIPHGALEGSLFPGVSILALAIVAITSCSRTLARCGADLHGPRSSWSRRLLTISGVLTFIVLARVWTGPWGWHFGPIPLPPFQPMQLFTLALATGLAGVLLSEVVRDAWHRRDPVTCYALGVLMLFLLALGPEVTWAKPSRALAFGPYRVLMALPGFETLRVPARAWLLAALCLAVLVAFGVAAIIRRHPRHQRILVVVLAAAILYEGWVSDVTLPAPRAMRAGVIPPGAVVLELPMKEVPWNTAAQYRAVLGDYRTVNGYSGYEPPHFAALRLDIAMRRPVLDRYRRAGELYVIIHRRENPEVARWIATQPQTDHLFDIDDTRIYRMARVAD